jgi:hypothetical protein
MCNFSTQKFLESFLLTLMIEDIVALSTHFMSLAFGYNDIPYSREEMTKRVVER